jgi:opacity protein-like surface antigen
MKRVLLTGLTFFALSSVALAADPAIPPAGFTWTGAYAGIAGGLGAGIATAANDLTTDAFNEGVGVAAVLGLSPRGLVGNAALGYNYQLGQFVVGVEATGGFMGLDDMLTFDTVNVDGDGQLLDDQGTVSYGWYATLSGRIGVAFDRTLLYATAGGIVAQYTATYGDLEGAALNANDVTTLSGPQFGFLFGGGAEFAFDTNWSAKLEYNYFNLGTDTTNNVDGDIFIHRNANHLIRFGLNYLLPN